MSNNAGGGIDANLWEQFFGQQGAHSGTNTNAGNSSNSNAPTTKDVDILGTLLHIQCQARAFRQYQIPMPEDEEPDPADEPTVFPDAGSEPKDTPREIWF